MPADIIDLATPFRRTRDYVRLENFLAALDCLAKTGAPDKMTFSLADQKQREDVVAYLQTVGK